MDALAQLKQQAQERIDKKAENFINSLVGNKSTSTTHTTCSSAPAYGWSVEDYNDMPRVADVLRSNGLKVTSQVNHGVTDWNIYL